MRDLGGRGTEGLTETHENPDTPRGPGPGQSLTRALKEYVWVKVLRDN